MRLAVIGLLIGIAAPVAAEEKVTPPRNATFTGIHRNHHARRPETVTITNGKTFIILSEEEYRAGGYSSPYQTLPMIVVQRLPVQIHIPIDQGLPDR